MVIKACPCAVTELSKELSNDVIESMTMRTGVHRSESAYLSSSNTLNAESRSKAKDTRRRVRIDSGDRPCFPVFASSRFPKMLRACSGEKEPEVSMQWTGEVGSRSR